MSDASKLCEACGASLGAGARFCKACGKPAPTNQAAEAGPAAPPSSTDSKGLALGGALAAAGALAGLVAFLVLALTGGDGGGAERTQAGGGTSIPTAREARGTEVSPRATSTPGATPTPGTAQAAGFDTPEEAIYSFAGDEGSPFLECSSQEPDTTYPCFHYWGETEDGGLIYQYATDPGSSWWMLVQQQAEGTYTVEELRFDVAEIEYADEPPF